MRVRKLVWSRAVIEKLHTKHRILPNEVKAVCAGTHIAWAAREMTEAERHRFRKRRP